MNALPLANEQLPDFVLPEGGFIFKLDLQNDGTTQLVELSEEQAASLGIEVSNTFESDTNAADTGSCMDDELVAVDEQEEEVENIDRKDDLNFVYRVVRPEELNLKPVVTTQITRGRPKKRPLEKPVVGKQLRDENGPPKVRTRSGRITRPPKHIEQNFKKIDVVERELNGDLVTKEFEPLKTNEKPEEKYEGDTPLLQLTFQKRKRNIASQYRCPVCKKAYLGQTRILKHLQKYPEHGTIPDSQRQESSSWKFLIDTALKAPVGSRAKAFCEELSMLLQNARTLAKYLFKPLSKDTSFDVDEALATALAIAPGTYNINESDLCKDVSLFSYLDMNYFDETYLNHPDPKPKDSSIVIKSEDQKFEYKESFAPTIQPVVKESYATPKKDAIRTEKNAQSEIKASESELEQLHDQLLAADVEELILTQASIMDTSTSSDDIMNVDQFVNERFKKLTEPDLELPNTTLDLPTMDLFHFHGT